MVETKCYFYPNFLNGPFNILFSFPILRLSFWNFIWGRKPESKSLLNFSNPIICPRPPFVLLVYYFLNSLAVFYSFLPFITLSVFKRRMGPQNAVDNRQGLPWNYFVKRLPTISPCIYLNFLCLLKSLQENPWQFSNWYGL